MRPRPPFTREQVARNNLVQFLYGCRSEVLPEITAATIADLQRRYGCDARTAEYELTVARQKRLGGAA